ncbi:MAG: PAS domain S-box protein [Methanoregula sp.]
MFSVLYVDDERDLLELGKLYLEQSPEFHIETAISASDALASPAFRSYDAIVSDYQMPEMDGIAFLKAVREQFGDIPFILFTGRGREDVVIEAINNGVDFYLQKGGDIKAQFAELTHKIRQAVARRQAQHSLKESEKLLSDIIEFLPDATLAINREGIIIAWNRAIESMTGLSAEKMLGKGDHEYALPFYGERRPILIDLIFEPDEVIEQKYTHIVREKDVLIADTSLPLLQGRAVTLFGKASPLYNSQGEIVGAIEAIRDITDRKKAEDELQAAYEQITASEEELREQLDVLVESEQRAKENEENYRSLVELSPLAVIVHRDGKVIYANQEAVRLAGTERLEDLIGKEVMPFIHPDDRSMALEDFRLMSEEGKTILLKEERLLTIDKKPFTVEVAAKPILYQHLRSVLVVFRDITERKKMETELQAAYKQITASEEKLRGQLDDLAGNQAALKVTEEKFRAVFEKSHDALMLSDGERLIDCNSRAIELFGYRSLDELAALHPADASPKFQPDGQDSRSAAEAHLKVAFEKGEDRFEWVHQRKDGSTFAAEVFLSSFELEGKMLLQTSIRDITDRKQAEDALRESEEKYRLLADTSPEMIYYIDIDGYVKYVNQAASRQFHAAPVDLIGKHLSAIFPPKIAQRHLDAIRKVTVERQMLRQESHEEFPTGTVDIDVRLVPVINNKNQVIGVLGLSNDITEQKQIEEALRDREETYRTMLDGIQDVFYRCDLEGNLIVASPSIAITFGYDSIDECLGKNIAQQFWLYPERRQAFIEEMKKQGSVSNYEVILKRKDGSPVTVSTSSHFYYDRQGEIAGVEGIFHDITAIRLADQQIQLLADLIGITPASVTVHDAKGRFLYANQRTFDLHGWTREEFMALNLHQLDVPVSEELINERIETLKERGEVSFDVEHYRKDGSTVPLHVNTKITRWNDRDVIMSVATDLTTRKAAEKALQEAKETYRTLVDNIQSIVYTISPDGILTFVSPSWTKLLGHELNEVIDHDFRIFVHKDDVPACEEFLKKTVETRTTQPGVEYRIFHKNGSIRWQISNLTPVFDDQNTLTSFVGNAIDITESRNLENAFRETNHKLNLLNSITRHDVANQLTSLQGFAQIAALKKGDPVITDYLHKIITAADTITRQIEFTKAYQELGVKAPSWNPVGEVIAHIESRVPVTFSGTCKGVEIFADPMLERVFFNLVDNAIRHGGRVTEITIRCEREPDGILVIVEDNGIGIPVADKEKIFNRGFGKNTGLGLFLVREILSITGITIKETGISGKGARFEINVPEGMYRFTKT